ncbi:16S rRNA (adenine(1518)-N(6)/adenine(1519)-N(6))-dimethyltransferase RsmA [Caviibacter abscessus]|uniref:16S rRNA (adenine(1518)-N(6)/adenine(1519)-N(6))- dimethyltransferase RsmA n=1 Tax=Caviibacter abscessus TaxID=1766719 RepID=UPI0008329D14|nr:16S rRNA (adenine(1518)-N(6)/adenine(1519)-N(6))-dimethyltransferase RsmA [Caviibacter abscessus]
MSYIHKKKYGQNFLNSDELLSKIKDTVNINNNDHIIEIGPGHGFLTKMLLDNSKKLDCYEIDKDLIPYLNNKFKNYSNFTLINQDFMTVDIKGENIKVIANIPYYITTPIIEKLIENRDKINEIYLMVQKEVAQRICSKYKSSDVSMLTHFVRFFCEPYYLFTVEKEMFEPIPKVDSAFIKLEIRKDNKYEKEIKHEKYFNFLKLAFSNKRKSLVNNLKSLNINKEKLINLLPNDLVRAEELSIEQFISLIKEIDKL